MNLPGRADIPAGTASSAPIPIRKEQKPLTPPLACALGMAVSYYTYPFLISLSFGLYLLLGLLLILAAAVSFLRVLNFPFRAPGENFSQAPL